MLWKMCNAGFGAVLSILSQLYLTSLRPPLPKQPNATHFGSKSSLDIVLIHSGYFSSNLKIDRNSRSRSPLSLTISTATPIYHSRQKILLRVGAYQRYIDIPLSLILVVSRWNGLLLKLLPATVLCPCGDEALHTRYVDALSYANDVFMATHGVSC